MKKKNEFNEEKFIRKKKSFETIKQLEKYHTIDRLSTPKTYHHISVSAHPHRRIKTISYAISSPINANTNTFITSPPHNDKINSQNKDFFKKKSIINSNYIRKSSIIPTKETNDGETEPIFKSPKQRISIFDTYKPQIEGEVIKKAEFDEKKYKVFMRNRQNNKSVSSKFERFFQRCDAESFTQNEETKELKERFHNFREEYAKMNTNANKNVERYNLHSSDSNFNVMRAQAKFKKSLIEHLLEKVSDKQDLISMYNKYVMMEENISKNKKILNEK